LVAPASLSFLNEKYIIGIQLVVRFQREIFSLELEEAFNKFGIYFAKPRKIFEQKKKKN